MTQFEERVLTDLSELKAHMQWLVGSGNEGKMQELETRVAKHENALQRVAGVGATMGVLITLVHVMLDFLRTSHR